MLNKIKPILSLCLICAITVLTLAVINLFTAPEIEKNQTLKTETSLKKVMGEEDNDDLKFTAINTKGHAKEITDIFKCENGGYVFRVKVKGFKSGLVVLCGINADGKITGAECLESSETYGAEKIIGDSYVVKDSESYSETALVSGATKTSTGYKQAIKIAFEAFDKITGGEK